MVKKDRRVFPHLIRLPSYQRNHRSALYTVMGKTLREAKFEMHRQSFLSGTVLTWVGVRRRGAEVMGGMSFFVPRVFSK